METYQDKIINLMKDYKYCIYCNLERTSTLDGDYNYPLYSKTFEDAYNYVINNYVPLYFENVNLTRDTPFSERNSEYYINSLECAKQNCTVFVSPDIGIIYRCNIIQITNINEFANDIINYIEKKITIKEENIKTNLYINVFSMYYMNDEKTIIEFCKWKNGHFRYNIKKNLYQDSYYSNKYESLENILNAFCKRNLLSFIKNFDNIQKEKKTILNENDLYLNNDNYAFIEMQIYYLYDEHLKI